MLEIPGCKVRHLWHEVERVTSSNGIILLRFVTFKVRLNGLKTCQGKVKKWQNSHSSECHSTNYFEKDLVFKSLDICGKSRETEMFNLFGSNDCFYINSDKH